jgi:hypothetical protein
VNLRGAFQFIALSPDILRAVFSGVMLMTEPNPQTVFFR